MVELRRLRLYKEVVGEVEFLQKGHIVEVDFSKTVFVNRESLQSLATCKIGSGDFVAGCIEFGQSRAA